MRVACVVVSFVVVAFVVVLVVAGGLARDVLIVIAILPMHSGGAASFTDARVVGFLRLGQPCDLEFNLNAHIIDILEDGDAVGDGVTHRLEFHVDDPFVLRGIARRGGGKRCVRSGLALDVIGGTPVSLAT